MTYNTLEIILFIITVSVAIGYVTLISRLLSSWDEIKEWTIPYGFSPSTKVSVVIAARNESNSIAQCLESIYRTSYPIHLLEIIVVDDQSTDNTAQIISTFTSKGVRLLKLETNLGKKRAITKGIASATGKLILCTDADCVVPQSWLQEIVSYYENSKAKVIAAPIEYHCNKTVIQRFQFLDCVNNMCVTGSGIERKKYYLANGANLAFEKSVFEEIGGFSTNNSLASGDDVFLIQEAAKKHPNKVRFLKSKAVKTIPEKSWRALAHQRKRWATKSKHYSSKHITYIQGYVFGFSALLIFNLLYAPIGSGLSLFGFLFGLFIKLAIDYLYLGRLCEFYDNKSPLKSFLLTSLLFLGYILIAGYWAIFPSKYIWKDRKVN